MKTCRDFPVGMEFHTPKRTVTETHLVMFAGLTGDYYPLHVDEQYAKQSEFGRRIAHGPLVYSMAVGLAFESGIFDGAILAFLGADKLRHEGPCYVGDTIGLTGTVLRTRPTRDGTRGVVTIRYDVDAVGDRRLMTAELTFLMRQPLP